GDDYDTGDMIAQRRVAIEYPITIQEAIERTTVLYADLVREICSKLAAGETLPRRKQEESQATYSLWRDGRDYEIDWNWNAERIARFVDAVGYPYLGANTSIEGRKVTILRASV